MNVTEYAKHCGRSQPAISQWIKPGGLLEKACTRIGRRIEINEELADALLQVELDVSKSRREEKTEEAGKYKEAVIQDKIYSAALKKIKLDKETGLLVLKADMEKEAFECARAVRDAIFDIEDRISAILAAMTSEEEINKLLHKEHKQALESVSDKL